jgi:hypothetical protein
MTERNIRKAPSPSIIISSCSHTEALRGESFNGALLGPGPVSWI